MFLVINIIGIFVFLAVGVLCSRDRKAIDYKGVGIAVVFNLVLAAFLLLTPIGVAIVEGATSAFAWVASQAYHGVAFAFPNFVPAEFGGTLEKGGSMIFVISALMPMLLMIPLFDTLTYIGFLPFVIKWVGRGVAFVTRRTKIESFFGVQMMFMGNTEALYASRFQLKHLSPARNLTIAMMSMCSVSAAIISAYVTMVPGKFVVAAVPLNVVNALIVTALLNPTPVKKEDDVVYKITEGDEKKPPFMAFIGDSILGAGRMVLVVIAMVVAFIAFQNLIDALLSLTTLKWLSLENILGVILSPFAFFLGIDTDHILKMGEYMGTKLITNEFVVMGEVAGTINKFPQHFAGVLTVFLTSFANFSTLGMVIGSFKTFASDESNDHIASQVPRILLAGLLVSLLSAAIAGVYIW
ncbi:MAG: NupC/NupG family nucleoside CNT transporter [Lactobacillales bacterium]|jgi:nucleoside transporter|nr:NupC/NupG family nucleoside CNT transporter [Lactobacillales bacterium]